MGGGQLSILSPCGNSASFKRYLIIQKTSERFTHFFKIKRHFSIKVLGI